jgi:hypothetical protein
LTTPQNHISDRLRVVGVAIFFLLYSLLGTQLTLAAPTVINYSGSDLAVDKRNSYHVALLDLVLSKAGIQYELRPNRRNMVTARAWAQLEAEEDISVLWGTTIPELEMRLLPVRIPIDKGILGWRLFLIKARDRDLFENIHTLDQLKSLLAGQQSDWADTSILRANGLKVIGVSDSRSLYPMLAADRFQYFPRGVGEIWVEQKTHSALGLEIEQHLALHYPVNSYFFVSRKNPQLAQWITRGLRAAIKDGSLDKLFDQYNGEAIRRAGLNARIVFDLNNPFMTTVPTDATQQRDDLIQR